MRSSKPPYKLFKREERNGKTEPDVGAARPKIYRNFESLLLSIYLRCGSGEYADPARRIYKLIVFFLYAIYYLIYSSGSYIIVYDPYDLSLFSCLYGGPHRFEMKK